MNKRQLIKAMDNIEQIKNAAQLKYADKNAENHTDKIKPAIKNNYELQMILEMEKI